MCSHSGTQEYCWLLRQREVTNIALSTFQGHKKSHGDIGLSCYHFFSPKVVAPAFHIGLRQNLCFVGLWNLKCNVNKMKLLIFCIPHHLHLNKWHHFLSTCLSQKSRHHPRFRSFFQLPHSTHLPVFDLTFMVLLESPTAPHIHCIRVSCYSFHFPQKWAVIQGLKWKSFFWEEPETLKGGWESEE